MRALLTAKRGNLRAISRALAALDPESVLARGYALAGRGRADGGILFGLAEIAVKRCHHHIRGHSPVQSFRYAPDFCLPGKKGED